MKTRQALKSSWEREAHQDAAGCTDTYTEQPHDSFRPGERGKTTKKSPPPASQSKTSLLLQNLLKELEQHLGEELGSEEEEGQNGEDE